MITIEKKNLILPSLCQTNVNYFWAGTIAEVLARLGVVHVISAPGSRSAPLTFGCALNTKLKTIPVLDERSAAFFALGLAKQTHRPVALICSSGTAAANFYPAIIEARMTKVPLIVLTADRLPEFRECHSGQAIDQVKMYSDYPLFFKELAVPEISIDLFYYLRQTVSYAYERSLFPQAGPVHLNVPLRNPSDPVTDNDAFLSFLEEFDQAAFFNAVIPAQKVQTLNSLCQIPCAMRESERGVIVVGTVQPEDPEEFSKLVGQLAKILDWPVLAEGLSPVRNYADEIPTLITRYDSILRNSEAAYTLKPEQVIQIGDLPTSKVLRTWLKESKPKTWVIENSADNIDSIHSNTSFLRLDLGTFVRSFDILEKKPKINSSVTSTLTSYSKTWQNLEEQANSHISDVLSNLPDLFEGKVAWLLSKTLPKETPIFISTSMPVRDAEYFWEKSNRKIQPYFNRGANGIDGIVSTALGITHENKPSVLLVGDLTLLHDSNGLLIKNYFKGSLTIVLINNDGGRIFEHLPVAQFGKVFDSYIVTPQNADFEKLAQYHDMPYHQPDSWDAFIPLVSELPSSGIRIIEITTNGKFDAAFRKNLFKNISEKITI